MNPTEMMSPTEILQQHQIKKTSPRVVIIQVLQKSLFPLTEADIKNEMGDLYDRITFYRSVQTMLETRKGSLPSVRSARELTCCVFLFLDTSAASWRSV
jgi:Fe2+ or Zn2+ uptake regulation protein